MNTLDKQALSRAEARQKSGQRRKLQGAALFQVPHHVT
jgi:hypothetical protein